MEKQFWESKISRIYLTSANSLKRETEKNPEIYDKLKQIILKLNMPKFVWCIDIAGIENYRNGKTSGRILIDSTCSTFEKEPWLLMHDNHCIRYYDEDENKNYEVECDIPAYKMYENNLKRI